MADLVAHGLGCNASGGRLKIDVTGAADSGIERVGARHETRRHAGEG